MRVTQNMMANQVLGTITRSLARVAKNEERLSTGKTINRPSDDALGCSMVLKLQAAKGVIEGYQRSAVAAENLLNETQVPLDRVVEILQQAREIAVSGSSDTMANSRGALAEQVNSLLEELLTQANTRSGNRYVFGGTQTATEPFSATRDAQGRVTAVTANPLGITGVVKAQVADGLQVQSNLPGDEAFTKTVDLFQQLIALHDALASDDTAGITATLSTLGQGIDQVNTAVGVVGVAIQRLQAVQTRNEQDLVRIEALRSQIQDANVAELYVESQKLQNSFQASLAAGSRAIQTSLLDYLR